MTSPGTPTSTPLPAPCAAALPAPCAATLPAPCAAAPHALPAQRPVPGGSACETTPDRGRSRLPATPDDASGPTSRDDTPGREGEMCAPTPLDCPASGRPVAPSTGLAPRATPNRSGLATLIRSLLALLTLLTLAIPAAAHKESDGYLTLTLAGAALTGTLDLHVSDLDAALGLDGNADGQVSKGEVRAALPRILGYLGDRLILSGPEGRCTTGFGAAGFASRSDGAYLSLPIDSACAGPVTVDWRLFFDIDSRHRGRVLASDGTTNWAEVLSPDRPAATVGGTAQTAAGVIAVFVPQGVLHILEGIDHVLFVLVLLLAAARGAALGTAVRRVAGIVTAFTLSHSVTLALASFGILQPEPVIIESLIALTVVAGALNVLWPVVRRDLWGVALAFGFIHGFGFANVLADLAMPQGHFALALLAFNVGVELGQLAIVVTVLPLLIWSGRLALVRGIAIPASAAGIALVGAAWLSDRALGTALLWF